MIEGSIYILVIMLSTIVYAVCTIYHYICIWASMRESLSLGLANNNKVTDQPMHPHSLISALLFTYWKASYLNLAKVKFKFSS